MVKMFIFVLIMFIFFVKADDNDGSRMRKKTIERFDAYIQRLDTTDLPEDIKKRLENLSEIPLNIAVTGGSGVGKSTLVNTFRGLSANDIDAAPVGVVEMTNEIISYTDPKHPEFTYWDLPGCGTPIFPRETYLTQVNFNTYDFFLIVAANRFTENDAWLASEIQKQNKQFFFIRNKVNLDLQNEKRDHPNLNSTEVLDLIRNDCISKLNGNIKQEKIPIYLISALLHDNNRWDFRKLVHDSIRESLRFKQELVINQLRSFSQTQIMKKADLVRSRIILASLLAAFSAAIPLPGIFLMSNMIIIEHESDIFKTALLLDEKWLVSLITSKPTHFDIIDSSLLNTNNVDYYKHVCIGYLTIYLGRKIIEFWMLRINEQSQSLKVKNTPHYAVFIEQGLYICLSFFMVAGELSLLVDYLENSALNLIKNF